MALRLPAEGAVAAHYLNGGGRDAVSIAGVDDAAEFAAMASAFTDMGIGAQEQAEVWPVLAGILALGQMRFRAKSAKAVAWVAPQVPAPWRFSTSHAAASSAA